MAVARQTSVRIDQAKLMRLIEKAIESPKARATLARVANDESRKIVAIAKELAEAELHRRPVNRRTKESLEHGAEYHDSFVIIPADTSNPSKVRAGITNTHPAARRIEKGTRGHDIPLGGAGGKKLRFPGDDVGEYLVDPSRRGGIRTKDFWGRNPRRREGVAGSWPLIGPPWVFREQVSHPGTEPKRILERAADRYRKSTRLNVKAKSNL